MNMFPSMDTFNDVECPGGGSWTCMACPVQAEGFMPDGRAWYFRARHGMWTFRVSPSPTEDIDDAVDGAVLLEGDDPHDGYMPAGEAAAIIRRCLAKRAGPFGGETGGDGCGDFEYREGMASSIVWMNMEPPTPESKCIDPWAEVKP